MRACIMGFYFIDPPARLAPHPGRNILSLATAREAGDEHLLKHNGLTKEEGENTLTA
jgi:hypothetical protein